MRRPSGFVVWWSLLLETPAPGVGTWIKIHRHGSIPASAFLQVASSSLCQSSLGGLVDLDIPPDQRAGPVEIGRRPDAESIRNTWLAAVIHLNSERFRRCAGRPDDLGRASERSVSVWTAGPGADEKSIDGLGLYANIHRMVVVIEVPRGRTAPRHETECGLRGWTNRTGN